MASVTAVDQAMRSDLNDGIAGMASAAYAWTGLNVIRPTFPDFL